MFFNVFSCKPSEKLQNVIKSYGAPEKNGFFGFPTNFEPNNLREFRCGAERKTFKDGIKVLTVRGFLYLPFILFASLDSEEDV